MRCPWSVGLMDPRTLSYCTFMENHLSFSTFNTGIDLCHNLASWETCSNSIPLSVCDLTDQMLRFPTERPVKSHPSPLCVTEKKA